MQTHSRKEQKARTKWSWLLKMQEFQCIHLLTTVELAIDTAWKWAAGAATEIVDLQIFMGTPLKLIYEQWRLDSLAAWKMVLLRPYRRKYRREDLGAVETCKKFKNFLSPWFFRSYYGQAVDCMRTKRLSHARNDRQRTNRSSDGRCRTPGYITVFSKPGRHYRKQRQKRDDYVMDSFALWE